MQQFRRQLGKGTILFDRYKIVSLLGQGGMGSVYLAEDTKLQGKRWAVKESLLHSRSPAAFTAEANLLVQLDHPYLPKIVDFYPPDRDGYSYLVMDYVVGDTLQAIFERDGGLPVLRAVKVAVQLCDLFAYLHGFQPKPIIYRDLKPSNIMIDDQDHVRLIDFGIARNYDKDRVADTVHLGTVGFAAPEQFQGKQTDARTDLYMLGALLYYLLSGGLYYKTGESPADKLRVLPRSLTEVIDKLLQTDPDLRYQTAEEVKSALTPLLYEHPQKDKALEGTGRADKLPVAERKIIVVGALYGGAGASFTAAALARVLSALSVSNALVELPGTGPDLYHLLDGDSAAPSGYRFKAAAVAGSGRQDMAAWTSGLTEWVPLPPQGDADDWSGENCFKLLNGLPQSVIIIDIGDRWTDPVAADLCEQADWIVAVFDPSPVKMCRPSAQQAVLQLQKLQNRGRHTAFIANRDISFPGRKEWLASLPEKPLCILPEIRYEMMLECLWKGLLPQDVGHVLDSLAEALDPLLRRVIPGFVSGHRGKGTSGKFGGWFHRAKAES